MAAAATRSENSGIFWMNGVSDEEQPLAFVSGVDGEVKSQTSFSVGPGKTSTFSKGGVKMRNRRSTDGKSNVTLKKSGKKQCHFQSEQSGAHTKEKMSVHHSAAGASELSLPTGTFHPSTQVMSETSRAKSLVCLKDLCPEDKRRIANLIEELARVSEEKEESVQRLKDEQENFERKIQQLEQQNVIIAQERESMQQQYRECQELLGLYQQYLSQQQAKLNQSIAQLSQEQAHSKVLSCEEAPSRVSTSKANGSFFDGSYLSLAATGVRQPQVQRSGGSVRGRAAVQTFSNPVSPPCVSEFSLVDGAVKPHRSQRRECREPHSSCEHCQCSGQDSGYGTQQRRRDKCHHDTFNPNEFESANAIRSEVKEALTRPLLGHEDWEEKRHQLLLQKMQLEMEREKLQARLAEQEERLNRQNQQLQQSRLEYSRFRQATQSDLSSSNTGNGEPQPEGPSHPDLTSCVNEDTEEHPAGQNLHEKHPVPAPLDNGDGATEWSRKDMAMSPARLSKPTSVSVIQKTPEARLDFSVVELLDIFSPISAPELSKLSTRRPKTLQRRSTLTAPKPLGRTLLTPAGPYRQHTKQDLEESQILEDIFFIC
ncbi:protein hinderin isoform X1 [Acanthopagrus latus]|uniref:protein hinderin isoform X1 n=2 Tax=Acanthopagrus latus TaxID=8177 RepID=UPI00187C156E|nr:protein hinderin isoform X1 [Acanthopagrus latus]